jgi:hypothetical protein
MAHRSSSNATTGAADALTGSAPSGTLSSDTLVACLSLTLSRTITGPSGWTQLTPSGTGLHSGVSYWYAPGSVSDFAFLWTGLGNTSAVLEISCHSGRSGTATGAAEFTNAGTNQIPAPSITAASGDDLVLFFSQRNNAGSAFGTTPSPSATVRQDTGDGSSTSLALATVDNVSSGATSSYTLQGPGSFNDLQGCSILLPASGGGGSLTLMGQCVC